jgi:hypothetical protein
VTQIREGLLGSTAMQLMKRAAGDVRLVIDHVVPFHAARTIRPCVEPTMKVLASTARIADAPSPEGKPSGIEVHGGPPVRVMISATPPMPTVPTETSTGG